MRIATIIAAALAIVGCQPAQPPATSDADRPDALLRWQPCQGCRIECEYGRAFITIVPVMPADPFEPVPDCTGCQGTCTVPLRDAGPETLSCVPITGPIYEPSCDGFRVLTESQRGNVWRDTWR